MQSPEIDSHPRIRGLQLSQIYLKSHFGIVANCEKNKKEVKTAGFSPPGVGWGVTGQFLRWSCSPALPGRSAASLADSIAVRDLPPKGLSLGLCSTASRKCQRQKHGKSTAIQQNSHRTYFRPRGVRSSRYPISRGLRGPG